MEFKTSNNPCEFSDQIISIVYGEIEVSDKAKFDLHTLECSSCADEIADLMVVRSSILDWRDQDFAVLSTPNIILPVQNPAASTNADSFFGKIFAYLNFNSLRFLAPAAALVLAICGYVWFISGNSYMSDMAANRSIEQINENNLITDNLKDKENELVIEYNNSEGESNSVAVNRKSSVDSVVKSISPKEFIRVKATNREKPVAKQPNQTDKSTNQAIPASFKKPSSNNLKNQKLPSLYAEEDEKDNVRLSDILEEVSMK